MNDLQKILNTLHRRRYLLYLFLAFLAGCLLTGFLLYRPRPGAVGILDKRYASQHARAAETVGRLEEEPERERMEKGEKPFDLIFMDIHMPVMDGLEAASIINKLQVETPIIAMTANILSTDKELYKRNGMPDYLGKPFTSQVLWRCLLKYFTPIKRETIQENTIDEEELAVQRIFQLSFAKENQKRFDEIANALKANDLILAHRLAHALKANAGQIGKSRLQSAATDIEQTIKNGEKKVTEEQLKTLETEMNIVLKELAPLLDESAKN